MDISIQHLDFIKLIFKMGVKGGKSIFLGWSHCTASNRNFCLIRHFSFIRNTQKLRFVNSPVCDIWNVWFMACMCCSCLPWAGISLQVCVPLIQSTLSVDPAAAFPGTPSRLPNTPSLGSATPGQKPGIETSTCGSFQLHFRCRDLSVLFMLLMLFLL